MSSLAIDVVSPSRPPMDLPVEIPVEVADRPMQLAARVRRAAAGDSPLGCAAAHHLGSPGKLARGRLALASCDALGVGARDAMRVAVACELLHNASLVHDDLQDRDAIRRERPAVWKRFGDAMAVNLGDHLIARAFEQLAGVGGPPGVHAPLVRAFTGAIHATLMGQSLDVEAAGGGALSFPEYERIARGKTGPLLALPVESALILAGNDPLARSAVRDALGAYGLAYQIQDDLLELFGLKDRGPCSGDLRSGRPNAVVSKHLERADAGERRRMQRFFASPTAESAEVWGRILCLSPAVQAAIDAFDAARLEGESRLGPLPTALRAVLSRASDRMLRPMRFVRPLSLRLEDPALRSAS